MIEELIAGDTLDFLDSVPEYPPADGWTLKYQLVPRFTTPTQAPITLTATTSGSDYRVQEAAGVTATWKPGAYTWARWVEKAGPIRQSLGDGQILIKTDPAAAVQGYDGRSHERKMLDAIEAVIESRASSTQREMVAYTIGSRSQTFDASESKADLVALHSKYKWLVANEDARAKIASGLPNPRNVGIRFNQS